ncbi:hypothetical protein, partial [Klebsiella pneumoniae]|uniref:hypothetical protein n=1 Tax=Klebsiella pneumoniae TaxID=573 RepID=UPI001C9A7428
WLMMSLWDALRMNMMISYQELVRTFLSALSNTCVPEADVAYAQYNYGILQCNLSQSLKNGTN